MRVQAWKSVLKRQESWRNHTLHILSNILTSPSMATWLNRYPDFTISRSMINNTNDPNDDINNWIRSAHQVFQKFYHHVFSQHGLLVQTKISVYRAVVIPTLLCGSESWTLYQRNIRTFGPDGEKLPLVSRNMKQIRLKQGKQRVSKDTLLLPCSPLALRCPDCPRLFDSHLGLHSHLQAHRQRAQPSQLKRKIIE